MDLRRSGVVLLGLGVGLLSGGCGGDTDATASAERAIDRDDAASEDRGDERKGVVAGDAGTDADGDADPDADADADPDPDADASGPCASVSCGVHESCSVVAGSALCTCDSGYQDGDANGSCEPDCGGGVCPAAGCVENDADDSNPCNTLDRGAGCSDDALAATYVCRCSDGFRPMGGTCVDIDECASDNGGCGNPRRGACSNNVGAAPTCTCADEYAGPGCAYHQVYGLDLPTVRPGWTAAEQVPYAVDNSAEIGPFDRVAYRLQLDATFVWVEFDAFTDTASWLGVPADETWDQAVDHVTVSTNADNVSEVMDAPGGEIEFWSNCYDGGPDGVLDGDDRPLALDCYGSLQVHRDGQTLFAVNGWAGSQGDLDIGIGSGGGNPDWTFSGNASRYGARRLDVYVHELATCTSDSCSGHGSCDDTTGIVQCSCDAGYEGALCQLCASEHQDNDADGSCEPRCAAGDCTVSGEYCFDDSGMVECLASDGSDCAAILLADASAADGRYVVDLDGAGGADPLLAYCDMTHGAFTLLAVAKARSTAFGNNSPVWSESSVLGSTRIGLAGGDYKGRSYGELATNVVRLCLGDLTHCHDFNHGLGISLEAFFANGVSYDEYSSSIYGHADTGIPTARTQYLADIGAAEDGTMCGYWLGINERAMGSAIGLMGDANDGCAPGANNHWIDDLAIGVGLQSCDDANSCEPLGTKSTAGRQRGWTGKSGDIGPWMILGR